MIKDKIFDVQETPCCGGLKSLYGTIADNVARIIELKFKIPQTTCFEAEERALICKTCDEITWITKTEFAFLVSNQLKKDIKKYEDLEELSMLPKKDYGKNRHPFCRLFNCYLSSKVRIKSQECDLKKWQGIK